MTWNVHSCIGTDRRLDVERVADVIAGMDADVVALQELEVGIRRTGSVDQPAVLARRLEMQCLFAAAREHEGGQFGNALLCRLPMKLVRSCRLPAMRQEQEKRVASWAEIDAGGSSYQVVATHLGLDRHERLEQVRTLLGPDWLSHGHCREPRVLLGDLNSIPGSRAYRRVAATMGDAQAILRWPRRTWPSRLPLARIDHVFCSEGVRVLGVHVPWGRRLRRASDHLPLVAELEWTPGA